MSRPELSCWFDFASNYSYLSVLRLARQHEVAVQWKPLLRAAQSADNKERLRTRTDAARALHIFGAPTFFVGPEMYWGNDRLADALALAART
ncbi:DsbA family protein [Duganella sp. BuS-21]